MNNLDQAVWGAAMLLVALAIVVLNDRGKERAQRKAIERGRKAHPTWANHRTSWPLVAVFVVFAVLYLLTAVLAPGKERSRGTAWLLALGSLGLVALGRLIWQAMRPRK